MSSNGHVKADELFRQSKERRYEDVSVRGHKFCLMTWTQREAALFHLENQKPGKAEQANERMISLTCVDPETKELLFSSSDVDKISDLDAGFVSALTDACMKHLDLSGEPEGN